MLATGLWLITVPAGTVTLVCWVTVPTTKPALAMAVLAAACACPTTPGTFTRTCDQDRGDHQVHRRTRVDRGVRRRVLADDGSCRRGRARLLRD